MTVPTRPRSLAFTLAAAFTLTFAAFARAQFAPDPAIALDEITVTATRIAQPVSDVPASVSVIRLNDLLNPVASLRDLARYEPGVSAPAAFGATGNAPRNFPTTRSFNIRGLDGNRVLIQVDGVRQPEQFTFGNAQLIGRDYFEPSLYRTAEILKGSASALYGSDAVGGVLSFISPAPTALLADAKRDHLAGLSTTYASATDEWTGTASAAGRSGRLAAVATATRREGHQAEPNGSYPADPSEFTVNAALFRLDFTPGPASSPPSSTARSAAGRTLFLTGETFTKTTDAAFPSLITTTFAGQTGRQRITRDRATLGHDFSSESGYFRNVQTRLSWQAAKVRESYTTRQSIPVGPPPPAPQTFVPRLRVRDSDFRNRSLSGSIQVESAAQLAERSHRILWGLDGSQTKQTRNEDFSQYDGTTGTFLNKVFVGENFPLKRIPDGDIVRYAVFAQDEFNLDAARRWIATWGLRLDHYQLSVKNDALYQNLAKGTPPVGFDEFSVAPKLGLLWHVSAQETFFARYHRGFRNPTNEDLNGSIVNLTTPPVFYRTKPNPALKAETSDSFDVGMRARRPGATYVVSVFYNDYADFIDTFSPTRDPQLPSSPGDPVVYQSKNVSRARIYGAEATVELPLGHYAKLLEGATWSNSYARSHGDNLEARKPLNSIEPAKWISALSYAAKTAWGLRLTATTHARQNRVDSSAILALWDGRPPAPVQFVPAGVTLFDLTGYVNFTKNLRLSAGLYNLTDRRYWQWQDVRELSNTRPDLQRFAQPGLNSRVTLTFSF
ncbi:MAG: TonB-dependent hemoglobin/transferrin/lactoferrin family receptor [Undibacterium sp.]|nr:TonB-dependent hemoglobin/transferrin/lactoferrin family receptor [Opitutaceae bacterium]